MDCVISPPSPFFLEDDVITVKTPAFAESVTEGDVRWEKGKIYCLLTC